jgi:hypothetical protein
MIPTRYKARLPKTLVYPIRAGALSDALTGVPQFEQLSIAFHQHPFDLASEFAEAIRSGRPYAVVRARYVRTPMGLSESKEWAEKGLYGPRWELVVYSVPIRLAGPACAQITESGLPTIRAWLLQPRSKVWAQSSHQCEVQFSAPVGGADESAKSGGNQLGER